MSKNLYRASNGKYYTHKETEKEWHERKRKEIAYKRSCQERNVFLNMVEGVVNLFLGKKKY